MRLDSVSTGLQTFIQCSAKQAFKLRLFYHFHRLLSITMFYGATRRRSIDVEQSIEFYFICFKIFHRLCHSSQNMSHFMSFVSKYVTSYVIVSKYVTIHNIFVLNYVTVSSIYFFLVQCVIFLTLRSRYEQLGSLNALHQLTRGENELWHGGRHRGW